MKDGMSHRPPQADSGKIRALRADDKRAALLKAARQLFIIRGYHDTRPQDISRLAGVGYGTFYLHFEDKQACFLAFSLEAQKEFDQFVSARLWGAHNLKEFMERGADAACEFSEQNPGLMATLSIDMGVIAADAAPSENLFRQWSKRWTRLVTYLTDTGQIAPGLNPIIITSILTNICNISTYVFGHHRIPRREIAETLARFVIQGLGLSEADALRPMDVRAVLIGDAKMETAPAGAVPAA